MWIRSTIALAGVVLARAALASVAAPPDDVAARDARAAITIHARVGACAVDVRSRPVTLRVACDGASARAAQTSRAASDE